MVNSQMSFDGNSIESKEILPSPGFLPERYQLLELIGQGASGKVFRAFDQILNREVAIKMLRFEGASAFSRERFLREARALAVLSHPNVVRIFGSDVDSQGNPYHVMELIKGVSLAEELKSGPLDARHFFEAFSGVLAGLVHAHEHKIVHRDLKPSNIICTKDIENNSVYKIIDFGIAYMEMEPEREKVTLTATGALLGSPAYMSPEQCRGERGDAFSDIYSIGCIMYECVTGSPPFKEQTAYETMYRHMSTAPPGLTKGTRAQGSLRLAVLITKCLAKSPQERPQNAAKLAGEISEIFSTSRGKLDLFSVHALRRQRPSLRKLSLILAAGAAVLAFLSVPSFFFFSEKRHCSADDLLARSAQEKISIDIEKLKSKPNKDLSTWFSLGRTQLKSSLLKDNADAEKTYSEALEYCKREKLPIDRIAACYALRAKSEWKQNNFKQAERDFDSSIALVKKLDSEIFHDILLERVLFYIHARRFNDALVDLNTVVGSFDTAGKQSLLQVIDKLDNVSQKLDKAGDCRKAMVRDLGDELRKTQSISEKEFPQILLLADKLADVMYKLELRSERKDMLGYLSSLRSAGTKSNSAQSRTPAVSLPAR